MEHICLVLPVSLLGHLPRYFINHRLSCKTVWKLEPFPQSVPAQQHQAAAQAQVADSVLSVLLKVGGSAMFRDQIGSVCVGFGFGWIPRKMNGAMVQDSEGLASWISCTIQSWHYAGCGWSRIRTGAPRDTGCSGAECRHSHGRFWWFFLVLNICQRS